MVKLSMDRIHGHGDPTIPAGEFKQKCLALLDRVSETGESVIVTKRGRPVARLVPIESPPARIRGSLRVLTEDENELFSSGEMWEAAEGG